MFGFIDTPGVASAPPSRLVNIPVEAVVVDLPENGMPGEGPEARPDPFKDWKPEELQARLTKGRVRWGLVVSMVVLLSVIGLTAYWVYQLPQSEARQARENLVAASDGLEESLIEFQALNSSLASPTLDNSAANQVLLALDSVTRDFFAAAGRVPASDADARNLALEVSADVAAAQTVFTQAFTYRIAVVPILVPPQLETDASLTDLESAAAAFAEWEARFNSVRSSLPDEILPSVTTRLNFISASLPNIQQTYLSALGSGDTEGAIDALEALERSLNEAASALFTGLSEVSDTAAELIADSLAGLASIRSLLG